jgi:vancomycin aglycone glucosyltransferase
MRVLLSTIGTRGEVQPLVALALQLRALGHEVRACVPPDFRDWIEGLGIPVVPVGPELRPTAAPGRSVRPAQLSPEQRRQLIEGTVAAQFATIPEAARGCDLVVGCGALQVAAPSVAELLGIGYVHAHYCPITLPSPHHAPPPLGWPVDEAADNLRRWEADAQRWNEHWRAALNAQRASAGLRPVDDVRDHVFTDRPWLAADPTLAPWPEPGDPNVVQTGAWILPDARPLPAELEAFLDAGEPPISFGLGSVRAPGEGVSRVMMEAARALGRRAIVSRGWADLAPADDGPDCISIGEANHQALFQRVAAVVHHGGAGTTTAVALAGVPQVVLPQMYDQHYWAGRVRHLGIGVAHAPGMPTAASLTAALGRALEPAVAARAWTLGPAVRTDGALAAARRLTGAG